MSVGERLKKARKRKKLTQEEVATLLYCTPQAISRYETNKIEPNMQILQKMCIIYEVSADDIIDIPHFRRGKL